MKNEKNRKLFRRESEEAAELVTDGSCCPTPFFLNNTRTKWRKTQKQFLTIQEQNEEKSQTQFGTIQEWMKKNHKHNLQQYKNEWRKIKNSISNNTRTKWRKKRNKQLQNYIIQQANMIIIYTRSHTPSCIFSTIYFMDITIPAFEDCFEFSKWKCMSVSLSHVRMWKKSMKIFQKWTLQQYRYNWQLMLIYCSAPCQDVERRQ